MVMHLSLMKEPTVRYSERGPAYRRRMEQIRKAGELASLRKLCKAVGESSYRHVVNVRGLGSTQPRHDLHHIYPRRGRLLFGGQLRRRETGVRMCI